LHVFDYIIVGAGSAGCVLANRLSEDEDKSVLLIEAGGRNKSIFIQMPTALSIPMSMKNFNWGYKTQPEPYLDNRTLDCPRGRGLGGSSAINGMVYVRGHPCDFDEWQQLGAQGWSFNDCLPYFRKSESWMHGADEYRGGSGPIKTCNGNNMQNPLYQAFIRAGEEAGYPLTRDYNGFQQEGFGPMHMTVDDGVRCSTARAYLQPALNRSNLVLRSDTTVEAVQFDGKTATGVLVNRQGQHETIRANAEVILSAGSIGTPTLLQRSGIGAADTLQNLSINVVHDLPGVGENLQDHLEIYFQYRCKQPITLNSRLDWLSKLLIGSRWMLNQSGLGATNHFESCAFIRSSAGVRWPDIQFHFLPAAMRYDGTAAFDGHGYQVHVGTNKPSSRGNVRATGPNAADEPNVCFNYISTEKDRDDWRACLKLTREILVQPAFDPYRGDEIQPAIDFSSDDGIDTWVRQNVESAYHPSCTCKMGSDDDPMAVLDADCHVRGLQRLRVVDSSMFPSLTNGNLNAPTIMAAEKAADVIRGRRVLRSDANYWIDESWRDQQRSRSPKRKLHTF